MTDQQRSQILNAQYATAIRIIGETAKERDAALALLRYVAHTRLPLGETVFEHLDDERQRQVHELLNP